MMRKISFSPLWKLLIDKNMKKNELMEAAGLSKSTFSKLNHNESVTLETIVKLCNALDCEIYDIVEIR